ncbi:MAG: SemiSWEET family transporter [bacterium]|nr:SemiSWEET family transporter [bacterium]
MTIGYITIALSLLVTGIGMTSQARKNYLRKSTEGLSFMYFILLAVSYSFWVYYGFSIFDYVLIIPMAVGALVSYIIVFQIYYYKSVK